MRGSVITGRWGGNHEARGESFAYCRVVFQERRTHDRRQTTRSGRRATDPREPDGLEEWPVADASDLTPLEKALVVTRRDVTIQSRQIAALHAELDGIKGVIRR